MLPTGSMHLVLRLADEPLRLLDGAGRSTVVGTAVVGGARAVAYRKEICAAVPAVGAWLLPGAARPLLRTSAAELAGRHVPLDALWGAAAGELRDEVATAPPGTWLERFELGLARMIDARLRPDPAIAHALGRLGGGAPVAAIAGEVGWSHRHLIARFREEVGLSPLRHRRVVRFQSAVRLLAASPSQPLAEVALAAGYSDQSHFTREFREMAQLTPTGYRRLAPAQANHVPVNSVQERSGGPP